MHVLPITGLAHQRTMRLSANLEFLFFEHENLLKRYELAAQYGFEYVEVPRPYVVEDVDHLAETVHRLKLKHALIDSPRGKEGDMGMACDPERQVEFRESIETAVKYAKALDCPRIHVISGLMPAGREFADMERVYLDNLTFACKRLAQDNINCLIEPINAYTRPGYFMSSVDRAEKYIRTLNFPNLKMQFDVFHVQQICGQLTPMIKRNADIIDNIQISQVPHRHEPDSHGEIDFDYFFTLLANTNPEWIIGVEYKPAKDTISGLAWIDKFDQVHL